MIDSKMAEAVLGRIEEQDLVDLALHITSVETPPGEEGPGAEVIYEWLAENDFAPRRVGMFEDRFNLFAELPGEGQGPALAFNSHIDTWMRRDDHLIWRDPGKRDFHLGREDGDMLVGNPIVNDKGPMAAWMIATKASRDAGVKLDGSIYMTMVAGEIGQEPVDEFQGKRYLSKEVGARYLVNHSPRANFCVCAEATSFRKGWIEAGKAFYKITVYGGPVLYTPYVARPYADGEHPNAIVRARERLCDPRRAAVARAAEPRGLHALPRHPHRAGTGRWRYPPRAARAARRARARGGGRAVRGQAWLRSAWNRAAVRGDRRGASIRVRGRLRDRHAA
jgi:hypothetical protein